MADETANNEATKEAATPTSSGTESQETTQPQAETADAKAPKATTGADDGSNESEVYRTQEDFDKAFTKRLEREREKLRKEVAAEIDEARKKEAERAKLEVSERLELEKKELEEQLEAERTKRVSTERSLQMADKVRNLKAASKLMTDEYVGEDGAIDFDRFFDDYPEQRKDQAEPTPTNIPSGRSAKEAPLTRELIANMGPEEYARRRDEIMRAIKDGRVHG